MGSQSKRETKIPSLNHYLVDTFSHSLCKEKDFEVEIPRLYQRNKLSLKQIADKLGVSRDVVRKVLKEQKIKIIPTRRTLDLTGQTPFGWKKELRVLVPHLAEQRIISRMVEARHNRLSLHAIARAFNEEQVRTKNGGRWHAKSISQILECNARLMESHLAQRKYKETELN